MAIGLYNKQQKQPQQSTKTETDSEQPKSVATPNNQPRKNKEQTRTTIQIKEAPIQSVLSFPLLPSSSFTLASYSQNEQKQKQHQSAKLPAKQSTRVKSGH
jgi:hypothetical protein